ncbi:MAG: hypothetical protein ABI699_02605 [Caldimonas sp.]
MQGGELWWRFLHIILLTLPVAGLVLWRYRRAVLAGMQDQLVAPLPVVPATLPCAPAPSTAAGNPETARAWERGVRRRIFAGTLLATAVPSLLLALLLVALGDTRMSVAEVLAIAGAFCSVAVPMFAVLTATPFWRALRLWLLTLAALAALVTAVSILQQPFYGRAPRWGQLAGFPRFFQLAAFLLWLPMLLGLATGARRIRGVAPIAFACLLVFGLGPPLGLAITKWLTSTQLGAALVASGLERNAGFVLLSLPLGLLAWWRLKALARAYEAKRFSNAQLLVHTWWLLVVVFFAITQISSNPGWSPLMLIVAFSAGAYLIFPPLLAWALRRAYLGPRPPPRTLLLLRVFGETTRTEALFDRLASRWQLFGPVTMIAAPDVIARTVDPGDILRFALGEIGSSFITSRADLVRRMATLDGAPDADGRYRINDFCCRDSTWQVTVVALMVRADAVVMDLRGFTLKRMGCEYELRQLAARLQPGKCC